MTSEGQSDVFIQKIDTSGNFLWAKRIGGTDSEMGYSIAVDDSGNVYTTGNFEGTVDFNPGSGTSFLTSEGLDIFVQKMDTSGNFLWAKSFGGNGYDYSGSITVDISGNVYITGNFEGTVDFNPGSGTSLLTSKGAGDVFIQKMDTNGNFLLAKSFGGTGYDVSYSIALDVSENVYTTGFFEGTADFDPGTGTTNLTSEGGWDIFVQKMSLNSLGIQENSNNIKAIAYPNPSGGTVNIKFGQTITDTKFVLTNVLGEILISKSYSSLTSTNLELPVTKGIYFLTIHTKWSKSTMRIVKK